MNGFRLMAVHAHPDDESSKGAATMARYVAEGHRVMVVTCTGGEEGSILNPAMDHPDVRANLPAVRRAEMAAAARALGVEHRWLGFVDSGWHLEGDRTVLPDGCFARLPIDEAARPLVALLREFRPHVVVTYDEIGGYPHPDHIRCHEVSVHAFDAAADNSRYAGEPWQPLKLYYVHEWCATRMRTLHAALAEHGLGSPYGDWLTEFTGKPDLLERVTTRVRCGDYFAQRDKALLAHATQIAPDSHWFAVPTELERRVWPTEEYELVRALAAGPLPENDLFAGIGAATVTERSTAAGRRAGAAVPPR